MWRIIIATVALLLATPTPVSGDVCRQAEPNVTLEAGTLVRISPLDGTFEVKKTTLNKTIVVVKPGTAIYRELDSFAERYTGTLVEIILRPRRESDEKPTTGFFVSGELTIVEGTIAMIELPGKIEFFSLMISDPCAVESLGKWNNRQVEVWIRQLIRTYTL